MGDCKKMGWTKCARSVRSQMHMNPLISPLPVDIQDSESRKLSNFEYFKSVLNYVVSISMLRILIKKPHPGVNGRRQVKLLQ